jgi:hypothetical protein
MTIFPELHKRGSISIYDINEESEILKPPPNVNVTEQGNSPCSFQQVWLVRMNSKQEIWQED